MNLWKRALPLLALVVLAIGAVYLSGRDADVGPAMGSEWNFVLVAMGLALALLLGSLGVEAWRLARDVRNRAPGARLSWRLLKRLAEATGAAAIPVPDQAAVVRGQQLFLTNCAVCHGADLKGDGPDAKTLKVPPADLTAAHAVAHQDADIAYWIENGIAVGGMPGFGSKLSGQNVTDIIAYVRGVQLVAMANRDAPGAEGCTVTARTFGQIAALAQTPAAARSTPVPLADDPAAKPMATPDPEVVRGVTDTARQLIACANAGLALQRLGLYTDEAVLRAYPQGPTDALKVMAATPVAVSQIERVALVGVKDIRPLADGRVAATVVVDNPTFHTHGPATPGANVTQDVATLVFVKQDGRWLIDDVAR